MNQHELFKSTSVRKPASTSRVGRQLKVFMIDLLIDFLPVCLSLPWSCSQPDSLPFSLTRTHAHAQVSLSRRRKMKSLFFRIEKKNKGGEDSSGLSQRPGFTFRRFAVRSEGNKCDRGSDAYSQTDRKRTVQYLQRFKGSHFNSGAVTTEHLGFRVHEMWQTPPLASRESRDILL